MRPPASNYSPMKPTPYSTQPAMRPLAILGLILIAAGTAGVGWKTCCFVTGVAMIYLNRNNNQ
jgi:hypothetical protein